ncbi:YrbL family protein [Simiduia curdlanivorans]|uniref:YrbL family protein n=1 Tax=Simiduia curdlanivorans TaxID=1492769 RepID=A0ABV8V1X4_9GAMM|nr:YrbL family protein [Simiduia curdlanivorans]MDN3637921.1 YrbL family protein [Simiduia curdlanivorans]
MTVQHQLWQGYQIIARGANRICVQDPASTDQCIKFDLPSEQAKPGLANWLRRRKAMLFPNNSFADQEFRKYKALEQRIGNAARNHIAQCIALVNTSFGRGLVCERVYNQNGTAAQPIYYYFEHESTLSSDALIDAIYKFGDFLLRHDIPLFDLNPGNLLVQLNNSDNKCTIYCIDLKSLGQCKEIIPLSLWFKPLRKKKIQRRISRLANAVRARKFRKSP